MTILRKELDQKIVTILPYSLSVKKEEKSEKEKKKLMGRDFYERRNEKKKEMLNSRKEQI